MVGWWEGHGGVLLRIFNTVPQCLRAVLPGLIRLLIILPAPGIKNAPGSVPVLAGELCFPIFLCWAWLDCFPGEGIGLKDFPGGSEGKASACNAEDPGWIPGWGRFPWRRKWQPTPVFLPGKPHGWRSLVGYSPWSHKESDTTEWLHSLTRKRTSSTTPLLEVPLCCHPPVLLAASMAWRVFGAAELRLVSSCLHLPHWPALGTQRTAVLFVALEVPGVAQGWVWLVNPQPYCPPTPLSQPHWSTRDPF